MAHSGKHFHEGSGSSTSSKSFRRNNDLNQIDFEVEFFSGILQHSPEYVDVLRVFSNLLSLKGRFAEVLKIDKQIVRLRPEDALAHYSLACSYALLKRADQSLKTLRRAVELGYRDFRGIREDHDLDTIKQDPRFAKLLRDYEGSH